MHAYKLKFTAVALACALAAGGCSSTLSEPATDQLAHQEEMLCAALADTGVLVTHDGDTIRLDVPGAMSFSPDSSDLKPELSQALDSVSEILKQYPTTRIEVAGHTDSYGTEEFNQLVSERRATAVASYLQAQGLAMQRINAIGLGESQPVAENITAAGRAQNRRVEITLYPGEPMDPGVESTQVAGADEPLDDASTLR